MPHFSRSFAGLALAVAAAGVLAACQGNIGGGSGLSIPQAPGYQQPAGPGGANTQSRERVLDGAVYLSSKLTSVPLPQVAGFAVTIALGTPGPVSSPTASPAAGAAHGSSALGKARAAKAQVAAAAKTLAEASPSATPSADASASAAADSSASPSAKASGSPSPAASGSAVASAAGTASASGTASSSPAPKAAHSANPTSTASGLPRIDTKTTVYPDDAPPPPTPMPTGEVQTFTKRSPLVRGYVKVSSDVPIYGLGAVRFTLPTSELTPKRGFTIALYESGKHNHNRLMNYDTEPVIESGIVHSAMTDAIVLKKGSGYLLMIYGDDEPPAPSTVAPGYPGPGNNPFPAGSGNPQPGYTQVPGQGTPYPPGYAPTPYPPGYSATPYPVFGTPHP